LLLICLTANRLAWSIIGLDLHWHRLKSWTSICL